MRSEMAIKPSFFNEFKAFYSLKTLKIKQNIRYFYRKTPKNQPQNSCFTGKTKSS